MASCLPATRHRRKAAAILLFFTFFRKRAGQTSNVKPRETPEWIPNDSPALPSSLNDSNNTKGHRANLNLNLLYT